MACWPGSDGLLTTTNRRSRRSAPRTPARRNPGSTKRKKPAQLELEEEILEKGWWPGLKEQQRLEEQNHSQVENEMARVRMQQLLAGSQITPDRHGGWPE